MDKVSAIVLAAGLSRRMGEENKLFLAFKGKPLVAWVIEKISQSKADEIIIVTSELSKKLAGFANDKIKVVNNPDYKIGMTTSIQKGILATSESSIGYMICLGDQPLIEIADYNKIIDSFKSLYLNNPNLISVPFFDEKKGNPVVFSSFYKKEILAHKAPEGCKEVIQQHKSHIQKIHLNTPFILQDVDTKEDYQKLVNK